jgi:integrase
VLQISTRCGLEESVRAELALRDYIAAKYEPQGGNAKTVTVVDVLIVYSREVASKHAKPMQTAYRIHTLAEFFRDRRVSEINGQLCREYVQQRGAEPAARRELEDLRAALRYCHKNGFLTEQVGVWIPPPPPPRARWLTRQEAASLVRAAWRRPNLRHVAKFCIVALYTGARAGRICDAALGVSKDHGYVDLKHGTFHPKPGRVQTKKRQPTIRLPRRLLAHLRRWHARGQRFVVEWNGEPVVRMDRGFREAVRASGLDDVTAHTLKHTVITWLLQDGVPIWEVSGYTGTSPQTIGRVYGHHSPSHMAAAIGALDRPRGKVSANGSPMNNQNLS